MLLREETGAFSGVLPPNTVTTVSHDFVGPLQPGTVRAPSTTTTSSPRRSSRTRGGRKGSSSAKTTTVKTVPKEEDKGFIGPIQQTTPTATEVVSDTATAIEGKTSMDNIIAWADKQSGGAPSIYDTIEHDEGRPSGIPESAWSQITQASSDPQSDVVGAAGYTHGTGTPKELGLETMFHGTGGIAGSTPIKEYIPGYIEENFGRPYIPSEGRVSKFVSGSESERAGMEFKKTIAQRSGRVYVGKDASGQMQFVESTHARQYGYVPGNLPSSSEYGEYNQAISDIDKNIGIAEGNKALWESSILTAETNLPVVTSNIDAVNNARNSATFSFGFGESGAPDWVADNVGVKDNYSKAESLKILHFYESTYNDILSNKDKPSEIQGYMDDLERNKSTISGYRKAGYKIDTKEGEYLFDSPSSEETHKFVIEGKGGNVEGALGASAFIESPLGIKSGIDILSSQFGKMSTAEKLVTSFTGGGYLIGKTLFGAATGENVVPKFTTERLSDFSLGLQRSYEEAGLCGLAGSAATSPAMVQGVYVPLLTMGAGYGITGLQAGVSNLPGAATSVLGRFGGTTVGAITTGAAKGGLISLGIIGGIETGRGLLGVAQEKPEELPGILGETAFTFGMAYGGYKAGQRAWNVRHTGSWKYNWNKGKPEWSPDKIQKIDTWGMQDVREIDMGKGVKYFESKGKTRVGKHNVDITLKGVSKSVGEGKSVSSGEGWMSWTETHRGVVSSYSRKFIFRGTGTKIEITNMPKGYSAYRSKSRSKIVGGGTPTETGWVVGGEPSTTGRGISVVKDLGTLKSWRLKPWRFETLPESLRLAKEYGSIYSGKYSGKGIHGRHLQFSRIIRWGKSTGKTGDVSVTGGTKLSYGQLFGTVVEQVAPSITKVKPPVSIGVSISTGGLGTKTVSKTKVESGGGPSGAGAAMFGGMQGQLRLIRRHVLAADSITAPAFAQGTMTETRGVSLIGRQSSVSVLVPKTELASGSTIDQRNDVVPSLSFRRELEESDTKKGEVFGIGHISMLGRKEATAFKPVRMSASDIRQAQRQKMKLMTETTKLLQEASIFEMPAEPAEPIHEDPVPTPIIPIPFAFGKPELFKKRRKRKKGKARAHAPMLKKGEQQKGLLSDLLSVTRSQARYGKATHPELTKKVWKKAERSMYMHVPTTELAKGKSVFKNTKTTKMFAKRKKNVFI